MATKISLDFIKRNKRDIIFFVVGIILSVGLIYIFVDSTSFLVSSVETSLEVGSSPYTPIKFNISGLKTLGIYQGQTTSTGVSTSTTSLPGSNGGFPITTSSPVGSGVMQPAVPPMAP